MSVGSSTPLNDSVAQFARQSPYPTEFRRQAAALLRSGRNAYEVGRELEVSGESVRHWVEQADRDGGLREDGLTTQEREEQHRLSRKLKQLETERQILVKAAAFFANYSDVGIMSVMPRSGICRAEGSHELGSAR